MFNNFNMEALQKIPLTLESVSQLNDRNNTEQQLADYKEKVKTFITFVDKQIQKILAQHQKEVTLLKKQIQALKKQGNHHNRQNYHQQNHELRSRQFFPIEEMSPIKFKSTGNTFRNFISDIKSSPFTQYKSHNANFSQEKKEPFNSIYNTRNFQQKGNAFPIDIIDPQESPGRSRFEVSSQKKKIRRQEIVQYLQAGCKNLDLNTHKLMGLIGRGKQEQQQQEEQIILDQPKKKSKQEQLNNSLAAICQSLDNSFVSKQSRGKKAKQKQQLQQKAQNDKKKQILEEKLKKDKGVKNLLQNSVEIKPQTVKTSKLLTAGENTKSVGKTSKVMFNPVPVRVEGQERVRQRSPSLKKSQSILKRKSSILTKSLQGISAISMHQC